MPEQTIWLVECGEYEQAYIAAAFTTEADAQDYADRNDGSVQAIDVHDEPIAAAPYWHFGADIFPDGTVERWHTEHIGNCGDTPSVDDHLNAQVEPWHGHSQGHCGFHVSIFGSDRAATEQAREQTVARYLELCTGTCSCGKTGEWMRNHSDPITREVVLVGGPKDGEVTAHEGDRRWDPSPDGLMCIHGTIPDGLKDSYYGAIERDGERWIRNHVRTRPVESVAKRNAAKKAARPPESAE